MTTPLHRRPTPRWNPSAGLFEILSLPGRIKAAPRFGKDRENVQLLPEAQKEGIGYKLY
jgi:hypothetical protein